MNKTGYVFSLIGGVLAILFSVLLVVTGPLFFAGKDISRFVSENSEVLSDKSTNLGKMWVDIGDYYGVDPLLSGSFGDYISGYEYALKSISTEDLQDMSKKYDLDSFKDLALLYKNIEGYIPKLEIGTIACLILSVAALIGAQVARKNRGAGGVTVLSAGALTIVFSLVAGSILPMAFASILLIIGGLLQTAKTKLNIEFKTQEQAQGNGGVV